MRDGPQFPLPETLRARDSGAGTPSRYAGPMAAGVEPSLVRSTLRALAEPRRLVPIVLVSGPLVVAQASFSAERLAAPLGLAMCVAFVLVAPLSWRVLFPTGFELRHGGLRLALYGAIGAGVVLTLGAAVPKLTGMDATFLTSRPSLLVCGALFLVGGWALARDIGLEESLAKERAFSALAVAEAEKAQLLALRSHLDPHFLFNTLNAIAEWCREDGETAERAVLQLSAMLRTVLEGVRLPRWPLGKELELVRTLFALHQLRDPDLFRVALECDAPHDTPVPPMLLLPLAENAVKHGPAAGHRGTIVLRVSSSEAGLRVRLENPGPYAGPRAGSHGLPTVEKLLQHAYGGRASLHLFAESGRTVTELAIPRLPEAAV
jgi:two-component system, LytTR family, sensor histidine kinase AlgZ